MQEPGLITRHNPSHRELVPTPTRHVVTRSRRNPSFRDMVPTPALYAMTHVLSPDINHRVGICTDACSPCTDYVSTQALYSSSLHTPRYAHIQIIPHLPMCMCALRVGLARATPMLCDATLAVCVCAHVFRSSHAGSIAGLSLPSSCEKHVYI